MMAAAAQWSGGAAVPLLSVLSDLASDEYAWQDEALCAEVAPDLWFPEKGGGTLAPKHICQSCPVREQCLAYAMDIESRPGAFGRHGVYGGTTPSQRDAIAAREKERSAA